MVDTAVFEYDELEDADLIVDAVYEGGEANDLSAAPLPDLLSVGTSGGFRVKTHSGESRDYSYIVLFTTLADPDWPDSLDAEHGTFTYYGDNKHPGSTIHDKPGNKILRDLFDALHGDRRQAIPPIFVFSATGEGYGRQFRGVAVPGHQSGNQSEDLVAIWKHKDGNRFQNYKATFTILDIESVSREWLSDLQAGDFLTAHTPEPWEEWRQNGKYTPLKAERTKEHREKEEQKPSTAEEKRVLRTLYSHFDGNSTDFEYVAAALFGLMDSNVGSYEITRPARDGGRDATGNYVIGPDIGSDGDTLSVEFALEAKCHEPGSGNGVGDTSRLISRLRHRQFGVFVTTSYVQRQAYKEIKQDDHPVLVLSGGDIAKILIESGRKTTEDVESWIQRQLPE